MPFLRLGETIYDPGFPILRMSPFQAGLARNWGVRLERMRQVRKKMAERWFAMFGATSSRGAQLVRAPVPGLPRFPLRIGGAEERASLLRESAARGLGIMPVYPASIDAIPELKGRIESGANPVAARCARELVTLPTHGYVTEDDVSRISGLLVRALGEAR
jgi:dTDP-4-amino-4,6-dideoxygalactose transaminase